MRSASGTETWKNIFIAVRKFVQLLIAVVVVVVEVVMHIQLNAVIKRD